MSYAVVRIAKVFLKKIGLVKEEVNTKVIILGLDAAGKTTILYKLFSKCSEITTTIPTIGFNVETVEINSSEFICWDIGGCDKIRPLWRYYITGANAFIFVVDSHDIDRIESIKDEMQIFLNCEDTSHLPLLLFANKQDLPNSLSSVDVIRLLELYKITTRAWHVQESVATTGEGLYEGLGWLQSTLAQQRGGDGRGAFRSVLTDFPDNSSASAHKAASHAAREQIRLAIIRSFLERDDEPEEAFLLQLAACSLDVWDHYTHLRLAWTFLSRHGYNEGCRLVESSIQEYILHSPRTDKKSFHKTMTRFWCYIIMTAILRQRADTGSGGEGEREGDTSHRDRGSRFKEFLAYSFGGLCSVELWDKTFFRRYYSSERMFSPEARATVVAGDLPESLPSEGDDCDYFLDTASTR
eukprot:gene30781-40080_t